MSSTEDGLESLRAENEALRAALDAAWRKAVEFPFPQVCKHYVAGVILDQMERAGIETPTWVYEAVVNAEDDRALSFIRGVAETDPNPKP